MSTQFDSATPHSTTTEPLKTVQRYLKGYQISSSSGSNGDNSLFPFTPVPKPSSSTRYYRHALSSEGKAALCRGELNHNLQVYSPDDIIKHHESRKSLVPQGVGANKLHKMEAFAKIEEDKQHSQRAFDEKASQSMYDLCSSNAPAPLDLQRTPELPPISTLRRKFSGEETQALASLHKNVHTASRVDYLSHHPRTEMPSSSTSRISSRIPRPLSNTDTAHQFSQNTTFDTFLVPHKSGKGEAYRNALNAKEVKNEKAPALRRFSKMRSTPTLRQRFSRSGLRREGKDNVPDMSALP
ncbi:hypothetical protein IQ06DRAFT_357124 [Phaeosphaeriaceae sp. SRC1lsM3a]|nr:hypothetical protein IQ06DRAFT_357124 [Stagonospora sp. SRC1lsM3a]